MKEQILTLQEWGDLYEAAIGFKNIAPWNWMWDSDLFGVQNPENGEIGYCCVMGKLGEHFALAVYMGTDGLQGYLKNRSIEDPEKDLDMLHYQKCLMASFEDRHFLQEPDIQVINMLRLKFRGAHSWPLFRSYEPGYFPWRLTGEEAIYLNLVLRLAMDVALRFKDNPDLLHATKENSYLVSVPVNDNGSRVWRDEWRKPAPARKAEVVVGLIDNERLEKINSMRMSRHGVWEVDIFFSSAPIRENDARPYFPHTFLCIDHDSRFIYAVYLAAAADHVQEFRNQFLNIFNQDRCMPREILVREENTFALLGDIAARLGIKLRRVKELRAVEDARRSMSDFFARLRK